MKPTPAARCCRGAVAEMVTATAPETIIARMPVAYAPAWALTSARKTTVMTMLTSGVDQHHRADRPAPLRRHAVGRQVARHDVDQPGHRRGAGEPEDQHAADVVDGAERLAELLVGQDRPAHGRWPAPPGCERLRRDQHGGDEAGARSGTRDMISAAVVSSLRVLRIRAASRCLPGRRPSPRPAASCSPRSRSRTGRAPAAGRPARPDRASAAEAVPPAGQRVGPAGPARPGR